MRSLLIGMLVLGCWASVAQTRVRFDRASGDYFVMVRDDNGQLVEMRVEPPNKVRVTLTPSRRPRTGSDLPLTRRRSCRSQ